MVDAAAHTRRGIPFPVVIDALRKASVEAEARFGIRSRYIVCIWRELSSADGMQTLEDSLSHRDIVVGIGLDNEEVTDFPQKFIEVFRLAKKAGFGLAAHCDVGQPRSLEHIRQCIEDLKVDRVDHGVDVLRDPSLIELAASKQICLTVCPTMTYGMSGPRRAHSVLEMLDRGLNVTVNTDDPGVMCSRYMNDILFGLAQTGRFTHYDIVTLMQNAFNSAWIDEETRSVYLQKLAQYVETNTD
jgi:adenosine deaminase